MKARRFSDRRYGAGQIGADEAPSKVFWRYNTWIWPSLTGPLIPVSILIIVLGIRHGQYVGVVLYAIAGALSMYWFVRSTQDAIFYRESPSAIGTGHSLKIIERRRVLNVDIRGAKINPGSHGAYIGIFSNFQIDDLRSSRKNLVIISGQMKSDEGASILSYLRDHA